MGPGHSIRPEPTQVLRPQPSHPRCDPKSLKLSLSAPPVIKPERCNSACSAALIPSAASKLVVCLPCCSRRAAARICAPRNARGQLGGFHWHQGDFSREGRWILASGFWASRRDGEERSKAELSGAGTLVLIHQKSFGAFSFLTSRLFTA